MHENSYKFNCTFLIIFSLVTVFIKVFYHVSYSPCRMISKNTDMSKGNNLQVNVCNQN